MTAAAPAFDVEQYVRGRVDQAPPLTDEQRRRLRAIFSGPQRRAS